MATPTATSTKHTPGPWHVEDARGSGGGPWDRIVVANGNEGVDDIVTCEVNRLIPECEANAQLIAAAPDLLAALSEIREFCDDPDGSEKPESLAMGLGRLLPAARAAIAKARGEP